MPRLAKVFRSENKTPEFLPEKTMFGKRVEEWAFPWSRVDSKVLVCALAQIAQMDCALLFASAAGGRGVACKLYQGKLPITTVVLEHNEMHDLLYEYIQHFASPAEDVYGLYGIAHPTERPPATDRIR